MPANNLILTFKTYVNIKRANYYPRYLLSLVPTDFLAIGYYVTSLLSSSDTNEPTVTLSITHRVICKDSANLKVTAK